MPRERLSLGTHGKITIRDTPNGRYIADTFFRDYDGKKRRVRAWGDSKTKAERALILKLRDRETPGNNLDVKPSSQIQHLAQIWWARFQEQNTTQNTLSRYRYTLDVHILPRMGDLSLRECTPGILHAQLKGIIKAHGYAAGKGSKTVLSNMFALAVENDALSRNPIRDVKLPKNTAAKKPVDALTLDEAHKVLEASSGDIRAVIQVMLGTGCRIGEALALRWKDIDLMPGLSRISFTGTALGGRKGLPAHRQEFTKSASSMRSVFIPEELAAALRERAQNHIPAHANTTAWATPNAFVFPSTAGTVWDQNNFRTKFNKQMVGAGLDRHITPHIFRKTVATRVSQEDSITVASQLLGHSSEKITEDYYIQKLAETPNASEALGVFFAI